VLFVQPFFLLVVLPLALLLFYSVARRTGPVGGLTVIVATSAIFYAPYGRIPFLLLLFSLTVNFAFGYALGSARSENNRRRMALFTAGILFNFSLLGAFKYLDGIAAAIAPGHAPLLAIAIPAGISFYTFHQSVFLLDAYNHRTDVRHFLETARSTFGKLRAFIGYAAFVAFFPQLVIGPITYMSEFAPQAFRKSFGQLKLVDLQVGVTLVVLGLFKKLIIADQLAIVVDRTYNTASLGGIVYPVEALYAIMGYYFQLYFDFSGYADIAIGIGRLFGIRLPINFDSPLRATGIIDFYRRWHITLTRVIALFLFTPLSLIGSRVAVERAYKGWRRRALSSWLPFLVNFQAIALWHGAKETFVLFGLIHGIWYVTETEVRSLRVFKAFRARSSDRLRLLGGIALTVVPLMLTFAIFRSPDLGTCWHLVSSLVSSSHSGIKPPKQDWATLAGAAAIAYLLPNAYELLRRYRPGIVTFPNPSTTPTLLRLAWRPNLFWAILIAGLTAFLFTRLNRPAPFLYAGF
jgi:alginate O-acetyltransferase complex protein AlgI